MCLTREQYLSLGKKECLLSMKQRNEVYDLFERYEAYKNSANKWDYPDRVLRVLNKLLTQPGPRVHLYDKAYLDECQDHTQTEYAIVLVTCGNHPESLCLASLRCVAAVCAHITHTSVMTHTHCVSTLTRLLSLYTRV